MAFRALPSADYLRECLKYDSKTGVLTWKKRPRVHFRTERGWKIRNTRYAGTVAGGPTGFGYRSISIDYLRYQTHRVIWKIKTGRDPPNEIDHKDLDRTNNRWSNLRSATHQQNAHNSLGRSKRGLPKGVKRNGNRYMARIRTDGRNIYLGNFATPEKAASVYRAFARSLHGRFYADPTQT